jgi:hypothetical protein
VGDAVAKFIEPILAVIPTPKTESIEGFVAAYARILSDFDDDVLVLASETLLRTMKHKSMPLPGECLDACWEAAETIRLRKLRAIQPKRKIPEQFMWTKEMAENADKLFASAWGRKAVADGVEIALWDFMVKHQRWPNENEYEKVRAESKARQAETTGFVRIQKENGGLAASAKSWLGDISKQSARLRDIANQCGARQDASI